MCFGGAFINTGFQAGDHTSGPVEPVYTASLIAAGDTGLKAGVNEIANCRASVSDARDRTGWRFTETPYKNRYYPNA